ncbi:MAG: hypothetical protein ABIS18_05105 [Actinomycetota bacterium]
MRHLRLILSAGLLVGLVAAPTADALVATTQPGSTTSGYTSAVFVHPKGRQLTYANFDIDFHDIRSSEPRPDRNAPHCDPVGPCPLFKSDTLGLGETGIVFGTEGIPAGSYGFYCTLHTWMTGTLIVVGT